MNLFTLYGAYKFLEDKPYLFNFIAVLTFTVHGISYILGKTIDDVEKKLTPTKIEKMINLIARTFNKNFEIIQEDNKYYIVKKKVEEVKKVEEEIEKNLYSCEDKFNKK